MQDA
jgi:chromosome segregation ATPase